MKNNSIHIFSTLPASQSYEALFELFFTESEQKELDLRLEILRNIALGKTQRSIAQELGTSIATVTRGAKAWRSIDKDLKEHLLTFFNASHEAHQSS